MTPVTNISCLSMSLPWDGEPSLTFIIQTNPLLNFSFTKINTLKSLWNEYLYRISLLSLYFMSDGMWTICWHYQMETVSFLVLRTNVVYKQEGNHTLFTTSANTVKRQPFKSTFLYCLFVITEFIFHQLSAYTITLWRPNASTVSHALLLECSLFLGWTIYELGFYRFYPLNSLFKLRPHRFSLCTIFLSKFVA